MTSTKDITWVIKNLNQQTATRYDDYDNCIESKTFDVRWENDNLRFALKAYCDQKKTHFGVFLHLEEYLLHNEKSLHVAFTAKCFGSGQTHNLETKTDYFILGYRRGHDKLFPLQDLNRLTIHGSLKLQLKVQ